MMTQQERELVQQVIDKEGLRYALFAYTDFKDDVKDPKFHMLRAIVMDAILRFERYVEDAPIPYPDERDFHAEDVKEAWEHAWKLNPGPDVEQMGQ